MSELLQQIFSYKENSRRRATIADILGGLGRAALRWDDAARQRRALARLDDRLLQDVGLTREEAGTESRQYGSQADRTVR